MKVVGRILVLCCAVCGSAGIVVAKSVDTIPTGAVDPVNAMLAAVIVLIIGGIIFLKRHKKD